jgi:alcohol dehydrogenase
MLALPDAFEFANPVKTLCGHRALEHLPFELRCLGVEKPLVIRGDDAVSRARLKRLARVLGQSGMGLGEAAAGPGVPGPADVEELAAVYRDKDCDALLALGQGTLVDLAKAVNLAVSTGRTGMAELRTAAPGPEGLRPLGVIPLGVPVGDETTNRAVLDGQTLGQRGLSPRFWVLDSRMMASDDALRAGDGFWAALTHAAEALTAVGANPLNTACAAAALRLVAAHGPACVEGSARSEDWLGLANGAGLAGVALENAGPGLAHRLAEALAPAARQPAARLMGVLLPHVLEARAADDDSPLGDLLLPLEGLEIHAATPAPQRAGQVLARLRELVVRFYLATGGRTPRTLEDAGLPAEAREAAAGVGEGEAERALCRRVLAAAWTANPDGKREGGRP